MSLLSSPLLLGFDEIERVLDRVSKSSGDGYPPYNIERIAAANGTGERLRITLAVAGFRRDELEIVVEDRQLSIRGRQEEDGQERVFLHRGIAERAFELRFQLAEYVEVVGAALENGLLHVELKRELPESKKPRTIQIGGTAPRTIEQKAVN